MTKKTRRLLIGGGITAGVIAIMGTISYFVTKKLVSIALDREEPRIMQKSNEKLSGSTKFQETIELQERAAEKLKNSNCQDISIIAHDGEILKGHLHICENAQRTIIAMHGWRSSWMKDFGLIADFWHSNNCNVLYAEQRGQGNSGGQYMGFGLIERYDCLDWIEWLNNEGFSNLPIYIAGVSMGAATVLMTAGFDLPQNVYGIAADCAYTSPYSIWKYVIENNMHLVCTGIRGTIASDMCKRKIQFGPNDYSCVDAMKNCKVPVLFIHGTDDHFVPIEMTYENYKACVAPKRLLVVPGAEHGMSYLIDKERYEETVIRFWEDIETADCKKSEEL